MTMLRREADNRLLKVGVKHLILEFMFEWTLLDRRCSINGIFEQTAVTNWLITYSASKRFISECRLKSQSDHVVFRNFAETKLSWSVYGVYDLRSSC